MKGHHGSQLLNPAAYETPVGPVVTHQVHEQTPLAVLELKPRTKRAADGCLQSHTEQGNLLLEKHPQGAGAIELMVDIIPSRDARLGVQGGRAAPRNGRNHEGSVAMPL